VGAPTHDRSRCVEHSVTVRQSLGDVPGSPGVVMVALPTVPRNAEGRKGKAAPGGGP